MSLSSVSVWPSMTVDEYASLEAAMGAKIEQVGGTWWRQVRPYFYRPLLPFCEVDPKSVQLPKRSRIGGAQFPVVPGAPANSHLDLLTFDDPQAYSLDEISQSSRRHIRRAIQSFTVEPIEDIDEFVASGHAVYVSFLERTGYGYKSDRSDKDRFAAWARALFSFPKVQVFGAYRDCQLASVSVSYVVEGVAFTATFFSRSDALKDYVADLMLHEIRERAAVSENVKMIFAAAAGMERGLDEFYLRRGARLVRKPALLNMNPLVSLALKTLKRDEYLKLGTKTEEA
jgi:hypothetical protein